MRVSIIGIGRVGSTVAYALCMRELCDELLLYNRNKRIAVGEALDLDHALAFGNKQTHVEAVDIAGTADSDIIILCASATIENMQSRQDLGPSNAALYRSILPEVLSHSPHAIIIVVANPVDILSYLLVKEFSWPWQKVVGTGTLIDSARYRWLLSQDAGIHPQDLRAYILGEHGESQIAIQSVAQAGGEKIDFNDERNQILKQAINSGLDVFHAKGYTNFAIGSAVAMMVESIAEDQRRTMPLSVKLDDYWGISDICLSVPVVLGREGVTRVLYPECTDEEKDALRASAAALRPAMAACGLG